MGGNHPQLFSSTRHHSGSRSRGGCAQAGQKEALEGSLRSVPANIMSAVESGVLSDGFQLGFALSIIVSYPLVVYPLRDTLWTIWVMDSAADTDA